MTRFITVPTVWETYECKDDVLAIMGNNVGIPPHIVLEMLVQNGLAKRINAVKTVRAAVVGDEDGPDEEGDDEGSPWIA